MRPYVIRLGAVAACAGFVTASAPAGAAPAVATEPIADDIPMADYLGLLAQIAPAAREGASTYQRAFQQRCGRPLQTAELRLAMSDGDGDPVLMAMIRASQLRDTAALGQLAQRIVCERRAAR